MSVIDYLPPTGSFIAFTFASLILILTPGPDMALQLSNTLNYKKSGGLFTIFGTATGICVHTLLAALGLSALLAASPTAFDLLKLAGAFYLLWLAISMARHGSSLHFRRSEDSKKLNRIYMQALGVNILNPKVILFFVTFLPQFVDSRSPDASAHLALFGLWYAVLGLPIGVGTILIADALGNLFQKKPYVLRWLDYFFGFVFGSFALLLLLTRLHI